MDSVTQAALGAAIGEAVAGKKAGNKAALIGAIAGTVPDLDVVFQFFTDTITNLHIHRGFSHSIFFAAIAAPIFGFLLSKLMRKTNVSLKQWTLLCFLAFSTHSALDIFTSYGTGFFEPFLNWRIAISSIGIIDPVYTTALLAGTIISMFIRNNRARRRTINWIGIAFSSIYLGFTLINKANINTKVGEALISQNIAYSDFKTFPRIPFNSHWHAVAKSDKGFWYAELNSFTAESISFSFIPRNEHLLERFEDQAKLKELIRFSKDYYALEQKNGNIYFYDLRFGKLRINGSNDFVFTFLLNENENGLYAEQFRPGESKVR